MPPTVIIPGATGGPAQNNGRGS